MNPKRALILMSMTGGGHRASAVALKAAFDRHLPGAYQIDIIDLLVDYTFWPLDRSPVVYSTIATRTPWLWGAAYSTERAPRLVRGVLGVASLIAHGNIQAALDRYRPDVVISVHPLAQDLALGPVHAQPRPIPFFTVVTDLATAHPLWLNPGVDACYIATDSVHDEAQRAGLREDQILQLGLPVRTAFEDEYPPASALKQELGLAADLPLALVMAGGDGVGAVEAIASAIAEQLSATGTRGQLAIICGRNEELKARLAARSWPAPTTVLGFVDAMAQWMHAADCLVTKAGPGSIAEATICGLPMILSGFIPGQEEANIGWVVDKGAGVYLPEPEAIGRTVAEWFEAGANECAEMAAKSQALGRPFAARDIVCSIAERTDHVLQSMG